MGAPGEPAAAPVRPLAVASDRIRETSKWLIVAFAAVAGALIAGSQLSDLGALDAGSARFWLSVAGGVVAIVASVSAIMLVSSVLVVDPVGLSALAADEGRYASIRRTVEADDTLVPDGSVKKLKDDLLSAQRRQVEADAAWRANPTDTDLFQQAQIANGAFGFQDRLARNVLDVAQYHVVSNAFAGMKWQLIVAVLAMTAGVGVFVAAANPVPRRAGGRVAVTTPGPVVVHLTDRGVAALSPQLGCQNRRLEAISLAVTGRGIEVVTQPTSRCRAVRVTLDPQLAAVRPAR